MKLREFISQDGSYSIFLIDGKEDSKGVYTNSLIKKAIQMRLIMSSILVHNLTNSYNDSLFTYHTQTVGNNLIEIRNNKVSFDFTNMNNVSLMNGLQNEKGDLYIPNFLGKNIKDSRPTLTLSKKTKSYNLMYEHTHKTEAGNFDIASEYSNLAKTVDGRPSLISVGVVLDKLLNVQMSKAFLLKFNTTPTSEVIEKINNMPVVKDFFNDEEDDIKKIEELFETKFTLIKTLDYYFSNEQFNSLHFLRDISDDHLEHLKLFLGVPITEDATHFVDRFNAWEPYIFRKKHTFYEYDPEYKYLGVLDGEYLSGDVYNLDYVLNEGEGRSWEYQLNNNKEGSYSSGFYDENDLFQPVSGILLKIKIAFLHGCNEFICSKFHEQEVMDYVPALLKEVIDFKFI